jgi:hypothetical protein
MLQAVLPVQRAFQSRQQNCLMDILATHHSQTKITVTTSELCIVLFSWFNLFLIPLCFLCKVYITSKEP